MKNVFLFGILVFVVSCSSSPISNNGRAADSTLETISQVDSDSVKNTVQDEYNDDYNYAEYFVVVADTGFEYFKLRKKMFELSRLFKLEIDTMDRHYDVEKDLIALPDDDGDEIYAGSYYPRRDPSTHLSLEYLNFFQDKAREKTIALVVGIYENEKSADSAYQKLAKHSTKAFKMKSRIYIGCMH